MDRTERFYKIQAMLTQKVSVTMKEMQETLEVSRATLCRDLEYLRDRLGIPIIWSAETRGYELEGLGKHPSQHELPGVWFSEREIHALLSMIELIGQLEPSGLLSPRIAPFKTRLEQLLAQGVGSATEAMKRIRILPMGQRNISGDYFQLLAHAVIDRKRIVIDYFSRQTGEKIEREVSPQRLVYYRDNWYLDGYCHLRNGLRSFSVDAIEHARLTDTAADAVDEQVMSDVFESSYGIFNGPSRQTARLKFTPFRAQWVSREIWHPEQVGKLLPDGSYQLEVPYGEDWELIQDILKQGADVEVLGPDELKEKGANAVRKMGAIYD